MNTIRFLVEYDGAPYSGWQRQKDRDTIQQRLEDALAIILRTPTTVFGSGRTDAGVHARGQVAHFKADPLPDLFRLKRALNGLLPPTISVRKLDHVAPDFHARFDARWRRYGYYVSTEPIALDRHFRWEVKPSPDFERMNRAARQFLGTHHFGSFCRTRSATINRTCNVIEAGWHREDTEGYWYFSIVGDRFLHGMVRALVGTLLDIGYQKRPVDCIPDLLGSRDRRESGAAVPAHGLVLEEVSYELTYATTRTHAPALYGE